ncbi:MAG: hypothetical protein H6707_11710 [Deltaproteobacteria bacterium]|nr:hypothetical protein [Deltaproteobacteria bacterium]
MIELLVNQRARRVQRQPAFLDQLADRFGARLRIQRTAGLSDARRAIDRLPDDCRLIAVCGGDGTISQTITMLADRFAARMPTILVVPGGTMNTIAKNVVGRPSSEEQIRRALELLAADRPLGIRDVPTIRANGRLCFMTGAALAARFLEVYYERKAGWSAAAALAVELPLAAAFQLPLARRIFEPTRARITVDERQIACERFALIIAATIPDVGLGMKVTYRGGRRSDCFHFVGSGLAARQLASQMLRGFRGKPIAGDHHFDMLARGVRIQFEEQEAYMVDGDLLRSDRLDLALGPVARFFV